MHDLSAYLSQPGKLLMGEPVVKILPQLIRMDFKSVDLKYSRKVFPKQKDVQSKLTRCFLEEKVVDIN